MSNLNILILAGELVRGLRQVYVDVVEVSVGKVVRTLRGLGVDFAVDDEQDGSEILGLGRMMTCLQ